MSVKDKIKGMWNEAAGEVKEQVGKALNKPDLQARGHMQEFEGKAQKMKGDIEDKLSDQYRSKTSVDVNDRRR